MDTGKVVKVVKNVPAPIPVSIPKKKDAPVPEPIRREEKIPA